MLQKIFRNEGLYTCTIVSGIPYIPADTFLGWMYLIYLMYLLIPSDTTSWDGYPRCIKPCGRNPALVTV